MGPCRHQISFEAGPLVRCGVDLVDRDSLFTPLLPSKATTRSSSTDRDYTRSASLIARAAAASASCKALFASLVSRVLSRTRALALSDAARA